LTLSSITSAHSSRHPPHLHSFPTRRSSDLATIAELRKNHANSRWLDDAKALELDVNQGKPVSPEAQNDEDMKLLILASGITLIRSEEHTSEFQSLTNLVCRLLLEKKNNTAR